MKKFEYKAISAGTSSFTQEQLNEVGQEGWEIVSIDYYDNDVQSATALLKREIVEENNIEEIKKDFDKISQRGFLVRIEEDIVKVTSKYIGQRIGSNYLQQVAEFHKLFNHPILDNPQIPDGKRCELRMNLLTEELKELAEAIKEKNIIEIFDAFADLQYVLSGAIIEFGGKDCFDEIFKEVHRSNMSKFCLDIFECDVTRNFYQKEKGINREETSFEEVELNGQTYYHVFRLSDKKTLKSINYSPADIKSIIEKHAKS